MNFKAILSKHKKLLIISAILLAMGFGLLAYERLFVVHYTPVYGNYILTAKEIYEMANELENAGIRHKKSKDSCSLYVESGDYARSLLYLSSKGLPKVTLPFDRLTNMTGNDNDSEIIHLKRKKDTSAFNNEKKSIMESITTSSIGFLNSCGIRCNDSMNPFTRENKERRYLLGCIEKLSKIISQIDGVANVYIWIVPKPATGFHKRTPLVASVMVKMAPDHTLSINQVKTIEHIVYVYLDGRITQGKLEDVVIVDQVGKKLNDIFE